MLVCFGFSNAGRIVKPRWLVTGSIFVRPQSLDYKFKIQNYPTRSGQPGGVVEASYTGIVPDTFKAEAEVVLQGQLAPDGFHVKPNGVVAKCPSKYEPAGSAASAGS